MSIDYPGSFRRGPAYTGRIIVRSWRGRLIAQAWPRKRGRPKHPAQIRSIEAFRNATYNAQRMDSRSWDVAIRMTRGTPLYPRDVLTAAQYGREIGPVDADTGVWYPVSIISDVSNSLDAIQQTPGGIIVRGRNAWVPLNPGEDGHVLTTRGPDAPPVWAPASGGGGSTAPVPPLSDFSTVNDTGLTLGGGNNAPIGFDYEPSGFQFDQALAIIPAPAGEWEVRGTFECVNLDANGGGVGLAVYRDSDQAFITTRLRQASINDSAQLSIDRYNSPGSFDKAIYREPMPTHGPLRYFIRYDETDFQCGVWYPGGIERIFASISRSAELDGFTHIGIAFIQDAGPNGKVMGAVNRFEVV